VSLVKNVSEVPDKLPHLVLPDLGLLPPLLVPALSLAIVGLVQGAGISQGYTNSDGKHPNASHDFIGEGVANVASSFFQGMPVGGSLSATSLVVNGGARTRWANIITGLVIAVTLLMFGGAVGQLAMPALAGLLIVVGFQMLRPEAVETVWKTGSVQQVVMGTTFVGTLLIPLQYAVLVGVAISLLLYAFDESNQIRIVEWKWREGDFPLERPSPEQLPPGEVTILIPYGSLFFAAAPIFEKQLPELSLANRSVVVLGLKGYIEVGSTFLDVLANYSGDLRSHNSRLILAEVSRSIMEQLERTGKIKSIGRRGIFLATDRFGESIIQAQDAGEDWIDRIAQN
jgi:sulfate permease, SulP family